MTKERCALWLEQRSGQRKSRLCHEGLHLCRAKGRQPVRRHTTISGASFTGTEQRYIWVRPCGAPGYKNLSWLQETAFISFHKLFWVPTGRFKELLIREGREYRNQGSIIKKHQCSLVVRSWFPIKEHTQQNFWVALQILKPPPGGRNYLYAAQKPTDAKSLENKTLMLLTRTQLTINQSEEYPWADHTLAEPLL